MRRRRGRPERRAPETRSIRSESGPFSFATLRVLKPSAKQRNSVIFLKIKEKWQLTPSLPRNCMLGDRAVFSCGHATKTRDAIRYKTENQEKSSFSNCASSIKSRASSFRRRRRPGPRRHRPLVTRHGGSQVVIRVTKQHCPATVHRQTT